MAKKPTGSVSKLAKPSGGKFGELGVTGLQRSGTRGLVLEEFLKELDGERARRIYREMRDNDAVVGAILFAIEMLIRNVSWRVEGEDEEVQEFVETCLGDMSTPWEDVIAEILSMLPYGFSWHEIVYKKRDGPSVTDPGEGSKYKDGKIGWRKCPIRSQDTLTEWIWDEAGGIQAFVQQAPPLYKSVEIPINRSLLFRVGVHKNNPEGRSILRNAYRSWYFLRRIQEIEAIGVERDLAGLPVIYRTAEIAAAHDTALKQILRNVRRDEQEGLLLPLVFDEKGNKLLEFTLLASAGSRQLDTGKIIERYERGIATTVLADFILLGQQAVGSYALSSNKTALFATALGAVLKSISSILNRHAIPRLMALNSIPPEKWPTLVPGDLETPDLAEVGAYITSLAGAGAPLFPDEDLEQYLREIGHLPKKSDDAVKMQEIQQEQTLAQQKAQTDKTIAEAKAPKKEPPVSVDAKGRIKVNPKDLKAKDDEEE